jgi:hypothetical protein
MFNGAETGRDPRVRRIAEALADLGHADFDAERCAA